MGSRPRGSRGPRAISLVLLVAVVAGAGYVAVRVLGDTALPLIGGRMPATAYAAYRSASRAADTVTERCAVHWTVLAGIGQVESRHGRLDASHRLTEDGDVRPRIRGPRLDGSGGTQPITDTDGGLLDGDRRWDRAVGPLQFIPTTWNELGRDGNGDGVADPDNLYDAALTAVAHLCLREPGDFTRRAELRRALVAYNASGRYADDVLRWVDRYREAPLDEVVEGRDGPA